MLLCIVYGILFVNTVNMKIKAHNALNTMFVETVNILVFVALTQHLIQSTMRCEKLYSTLYKVASHFNIQPIFDPQKVLESWDQGIFNHAINTIYVNTLNTGQGSLMHSMLSMSTMLI